MNDLEVLNEMARKDMNIKSCSNQNISAVFLRKDHGELRIRLDVETASELMNVEPEPIVALYVCDRNEFSKLKEQPSKIDKVIDIINEVESMNPYKVSGRHETFCQYNEGWTSACDVIESRVKALLKDIDKDGE